MVSAGEIHRDQHPRVGDSSHATVVSLQVPLNRRNHAMMAQKVISSHLFHVYALRVVS